MNYNTLKLRFLLVKYLKYKKKASLNIYNVKFD